MLRAQAGVSYALMEAVANGDCGLPQEDLLSLAEKLLEIATPIIAEAMRHEMATGGVVEDVIEGKPLRIPPASASRGTGHRCGYPQAQAGAPPWLTMDAEKTLSWVEGKVGVTLAMLTGVGSTPARSSPPGIVTALRPTGTVIGRVYVVRSVPEL
jgi:exodeoxyribonuclease V alpha subunit